MTTAVVVAVPLPFAGTAVEHEIERAMRDALPKHEVAEWQQLHNRVRPVDAARMITGGRPGAQVFLD